MSLLNSMRGWFGELQVNIIHALYLDKNIYHALKNVTLPTSNSTTQIDHIIVSVHGIFVVETKNMKGWIFGGEHQPKWTQQIFKVKNTFQNPLRQNYKHLKTLAHLLNLPEEKFFSVIMFIGECTFKTEMPENVLLNGYTAYIKSKTEKILTKDEVSYIIDQISNNRLAKSFKTRREHIQHVKAIKSNLSTSCPKCGKELVERVVKNGMHKGEKFYGCSGFPNCYYTKPYAVS
ncbi:MAG: NERD domain-containing protein [Candidatus Kuenenia sp.]|nr:NERD domain-containing protein [Candidatus Kuenenia hertensis]